jgi:signal transduction histidine kinase
MQRVLRGADPETVRDAVVAVVAAVLLVLGWWGPASLTGAPGGPRWLLAVLPLFLAAPLVLSRRSPLAMWVALWVVVAAQTGVSRWDVSGAEIVVLLAAGYWLGAHTAPRRSAAGLAIAAPVIYVCGHASPDFGGLSLIGPLGDATPKASPLLLIFEVLACWLVGVLVRTRRQAASLTARNATLEHQAEQATAAERARIARELHDIVAHHLSVMVLQAAGARASGLSAGASPEKTALEKIERSGRQALAETRRLLGVLRDCGGDTAFAPQPGIGELPGLADTVRAAGVAVDLDLRGCHSGVPEAVGVSAYRIVQEALTNVLRHAGPARATVTVNCADGVVTIEVTDDGAGRSPGRATGHGLAGMRERAAVFGGELHAGPLPGGGFSVRARLPLGEALLSGAS